MRTSTDLTHVHAARPVAASDFDGTLNREQLIVHLAEQCFDLQILNRATEVLFTEARLAHRDRKITFEEHDRKIVDLFGNRIRGKLRSDVELAAKRVFEHHRDWLYVFTRTLIGHVKTTHECVAITGAMTETVKLLAPYWGFDHYYGTELEINEHGRYTGRDLSVPALDKKTALLEHIATTGALLAGSIAIGDTATDIAMLAVVENPIAFNPNDALGTAAEKNRWPIVLERKDCIYVLSHNTSKRFSSSDAIAAVHYTLTLPKE